jgi:hypothetical protein
MDGVMKQVITFGHLALAAFQFRLVWKMECVLNVGTIRFIV